MELKSLVVIDCLRPESVSKLAWCNASLYGANGKIIRMARFCSCSSSADKYAGSALWNTGHALWNTGHIMSHMFPSCNKLIKRNFKN